MTQIVKWETNRNEDCFFSVAHFGGIEIVITLYNYVCTLHIALFTWDTRLNIILSICFVVAMMATLSISATPIILNLYLSLTNILSCWAVYSIQQYHIIRLILCHVRSQSLPLNICVSNIWGVSLFFFFSFFYYLVHKRSCFVNILELYEIPSLYSLVNCF